jgi:predicted nucleic acid-binding protein
VILADTNVVSEFMRDSPDDAVLAWAAAIGPNELTICVVTVEEIERGLLSLPAGRRRRDLEQRWAHLVDAFTDAIAAYDIESARATASIQVAARVAGRPMSLADAQIAGICLAGGYDLATRNGRDFSAVPGLRVINPFTPT